MQWLRKAAENGHTEACLELAELIYEDGPCAREVGHVVEAAGVAMSAEVTEGHDVPTDVLTIVAHWMRKGGHDPIEQFDVFRRTALEGAKYCYNAGCDVVGHLKDFMVCPHCKAARYCGAACQEHHWTTGGHKEKCGTWEY